VQDRKHDIAFMPHHRSAGGGFWRKACDALGIHYIDPRGFDIERVVRDVSASRLMIAEAMHGAIVADAFRVPWIAVSSVGETNDFKWQDWCGSLGLNYAPVHFMPIYPSAGDRPWKVWINKIKQTLRQRQLARVVRSRKSALLSDENRLDANLAEMDLRIQELVDYLHQRSGASNVGP
jgi:succinoglycan biosynthesis protein ExoV